MRRILLVAFLSVIAACDNPEGPDPNAHVGTYNIVSVNGESLPFLALVYNGRTTHILAGRVSLNADGTATDSYTYRYTDGPEVIEETTFDSGVYTRSGRFVDVVWGFGFQESFTYEGNTLTLEESGYLVTFRK
jgi:hypothetical protein